MLIFESEDSNFCVMFIFDFRVTQTEGLRFPKVEPNCCPNPWHLDHDRTFHTTATFFTTQQSAYPIKMVS